MPASGSEFTSLALLKSLGEQHLFHWQSLGPWGPPSQWNRSGLKGTITQKSRGASTFTCE
jgi:hypothetical protein